MFLKFDSNGVYNCFGDGRFALQVLNLSNRGMIALPAQVMGLTHVTHLYLNNNKLMVPPDELASLVVSYSACQDVD